MCSFFKQTDVSISIFLFSFPELLHDLQVVATDQEQLDFDEVIPECISVPVKEPGRGRTSTRDARGSRGRRNGRSAARSSSRVGRTSRSLLTAREIDESNGWSYQPAEQLPDSFVFENVCTVLAPIDENSSEFNCFSTFFPESFWKLLKTEINRYAALMKAKQVRRGLLKPGCMLYNWKPVTIQEMKKVFRCHNHRPYDACSQRKFRLILVN